MFAITSASCQRNGKTYQLLICLYTESLSLALLTLSVCAFNLIYSITNIFVYFLIFFQTNESSNASIAPPSPSQTAPDPMRPVQSTPARPAQAASPPLSTRTAPVISTPLVRLPQMSPTAMSAPSMITSYCAAVETQVVSKIPFCDMYMI